MILVLNLAEHDPAGASAKRQRAQVIPVEAAQPGAERLVAERRFRLLDRRRKYYVQSDDARAAIDDRGQHSANLGRPGNRRRAVEWRRAEGLLVEGDDNRGRVLRWVRIAEEMPAQRS